MTKTAGRPVSSTRVRLHRQRRARGVLAVVPVAVTENVVAALIQVGHLEAERLSDGGARVTKAALAVAVEEMLSAWSG